MLPPVTPAGVQYLEKVLADAIASRKVAVGEGEQDMLDAAIDDFRCQLAAAKAGQTRPEPKDLQ